MRCDAFEPKNDERGQNYKLGAKMKCTQKFKAKICNFLPWRQKKIYALGKERKKEEKKRKRERKG